MKALALLLLLSCSTVEAFPRRACVYYGGSRDMFSTGTVMDKRDDGARLFKFDDRSKGDHGYQWIAENDPSRLIGPCKAADALTPTAADALYPQGEHP